MGIWQKCPNCDGTGITIPSIHNYASFNTSAVCRVCNGEGIVSLITGKPPSSTITIAQLKQDALQMLRNDPNGAVSDTTGSPSSNAADNQSNQEI